MSKVIRSFTTERDDLDLSQSADSGINRVIYLDAFKETGENVRTVLEALEDMCGIDEVDDERLDEALEGGDGGEDYWWACSKQGKRSMTL